MARIVGWKCRICGVYVAPGEAHACPGRRDLLDAEFDAVCAKCKMPWPCSCAARPQPPPIPHDGVRIVDLVLQDLRDRAESGKLKYGTYLQPHNGRNALMDAYQEALDLAMYLRQKIEEE